MAAQEPSFVAGKKGGRKLDPKASAHPTPPPRVAGTLQLRTTTPRMPHAACGRDFRQMAHPIGSRPPKGAAGRKNPDASSAWYRELSGGVLQLPGCFTRSAGGASANGESPLAHTLQWEKEPGCPCQLSKEGGPGLLLSLGNSFPTR